MLNARISNLVCAFILGTSVWMAADIAVAVPLIASVNERAGGLPRLSLGGSTAMTSSFVFWGSNWSWTGLKTQFEVSAPFNYALSGTDNPLNFNLSARISKSSERQLTWEIDLVANSTTSNVIGGGISFGFNLANFEALCGDPSLLPDNRGWTWGRPNGVQIDMRFDPAPPAVFFEQGRKSEIRVFFYKDVVPQGKQHFVATLTLSGDTAIGPTIEERFGSENSATWAPNILDWATAPVDLSFLNALEKPAGKHGFLKRVNGKLVFEDGTLARFWGTNLVAYSLFSTRSQSDVRRQARRLSELGFNLVRLHHIDSGWVQPNVFGKGALDTQNLDEISLGKLDWWIKCLEDEGIYIWLDLHDGRELKAADHIDDFAEISKGKPNAQFQGYNYINLSVQQAMERFNQEFLDHHNRYTGRDYKADPAIIAVLLTNENDVTNHFGNNFLPDKHVPIVSATYMRMAESFANQTGLPKDKVWQSWLAGPSKIFLNDFEHNFNLKMIKQLKLLGVKSVIATTSTWGRNPLSSLPSLTDGDIIDAHSYGGLGVLEANPLYADNIVDWIAAAHIIDYPLSVTEWNVEPFPVPDRDVVPLYVAATADLQGWDALMHFAYSQQSLDGRGRPGAYEAFNDPALVATLPAAALLYRRHDAREAHTTYVFSPSSDQLFGQVIRPDNAVALRTAVELGKVEIALPQVPQLPWLRSSQIPAGAQIISDPRQPLIAADAEQAVSDTGELTRNWRQGVYTIDTPRTQAALGWIGGRRISLSALEVDITTRNATVAVQSLDENPISTASSLLVSLGARSIPESNNAFRSEPVVGHLSIRAKNGLKFYRRVGDNQSEIQVPMTYAQGRYEIDLKASLGTYWLVMK
jgi:hypothetical protein